MKILVRSVIGRAFAVIKEDPRVLLPYFLVYLLILLVGGLSSSFPILKSFSENVFFYLTTRLLLAFSFLYVLVYAYDHLEGFSVNLEQILSLIFGKILPLIGLAVLIFIINFLLCLIVAVPLVITIMLMTLIRGTPSGIVFVGVVGGSFILIALLYYIRTAIRIFSFPYLAVLFENISPIGAFKRSTEIVNIDFWAVFRIVLIEVIIIVLLTFLGVFLAVSLVTGLALLAHFLNFPSGIIESNILTVFSLTILAFMAGLISSFGTILMVVLYKTLTARPADISELGYIERPIAVSVPAEGRESKKLSPLHIIEIVLIILIIIMVATILLYPQVQKFASERAQVAIEAPREITPPATIKPPTPQLYSSTPGKVVITYLRSLIKNDIDRAVDLVWLTGAEDMQAVYNTVKLQSKFFRTGGMHDISIVSEQVEGSTAYVVYRSKDRTGKIHPGQEVILRKVKGHWKIFLDIPH